jgi:hypothetical protein
VGTATRLGPSSRVRRQRACPKSAFEPCIPTRGTTDPDRPDWIHEIKHDGYRLIVQRDGTRVCLFTRNGHDWSDRFPVITEAALRNRLQLGTELEAKRAGDQSARVARSPSRLVGLALPVMRLGNRRPLALAVVWVSLAVAAADRAEDPWTNFWHSHAGTRRIGDVALPWFILAEQPGIALNADDGAALFPEADRVGAGRDRDHQRQRRRD